MVPVGAEGKPLNLDFETGTLQATGRPRATRSTASRSRGTPSPRAGPDMKSNHAGEYWVGTYEVGADKPRGTLTSVPFKVTHPWASFWSGAGKRCDARGGRAGGGQSGRVQSQRPRARDMRRVVDRPARGDRARRSSSAWSTTHSGHWGHINFDDFRFHAPEARGDDGAADGRGCPDGRREVRRALARRRRSRRSRCPPGFKATLFAGEPDVVQPVALAIDDRGRLWVAEAKTYPQKAPPKARGRTASSSSRTPTATGNFDKRTVFIEGLNLVSGLEVGFGGVWVGPAPKLLFIPIKDGTTSRASPQVVLDGFGLSGHARDAQQLHLGPGRLALWLPRRLHAFARSASPARRTPSASPMNAGGLALSPDARRPSRSSPRAPATSGASTGTITARPSSPPASSRTSTTSSRAAATSGRRASILSPTPIDDIKTIADHVHWAGGGSPHAGNGKSDSAGGGHAHCGAMIYLGDNWPAEYRNTLFMSNIHGNRMNNDLLEQAGSGYVGHHGKDFMLMNDKWSRLISLKYGPDGGVYVIDWYDKQACHLPNPEVWDRTNGRIYKITYGDPKPVKVDLAKLGERGTGQAATAARTTGTSATPGGCCRSGGRSRSRTRRRRFGLATLQANPAPGRRLRAMWAMHVIGIGGDDVTAIRDARPQRVRPRLGDPARGRGGARVGIGGRDAPQAGRDRPVARRSPLPRHRDAALAARAAVGRRHGPGHARRGRDRPQPAADGLVRDRADGDDRPGPRDPARGGDEDPAPAAVHRAAAGDADGLS